jgi:hypothetical protein
MLALSMIFRQMMEDATIDFAGTIEYHIRGIINDTTHGLQNCRFA